MEMYLFPHQSGQAHERDLGYKLSQKKGGKACSVRCDVQRELDPTVCLQLAGLHQDQDGAPRDPASEQ